jgi:uncharacterized membrane protein YvbJ
MLRRGMVSRKLIIVGLVIVAVILVGYLIYSQIQFNNQAYKIENFNALWNQSLDDLRNGNTTIIEYCNNRVHDVNLLINLVVYST